jgi:hypothetical protein
MQVGYYLCLCKIDSYGVCPTPDRIGRGFLEIVVVQTDSSALAEGALATASARAAGVVLLFGAVHETFLLYSLEVVKYNDITIGSRHQLADIYLNTFVLTGGATSGATWYSRE